MENQIGKFLEQLGLSANETKAFLSLLAFGEASPHQIALDSGIERTTIYKILENLCSRNLVSKNIKGSRITYISKGPESLKTMIANHGQLLENIWPLLLAMNNTRTSKPKVRFYDTLDSIKEVYNYSLLAKEKIRRDLLSVDNLIDILGQRFIQNHTNERVKKGIRVQSIRSLSDKDSKVEQDWLLKSTNKELLREVKYLENINFNSLIFVYDNTITMISLEKDLFALVIDSHELSEMMKTLFDVTWMSAKS